MTNYSSKDIQVLEGLDPVRKRPGMYIGSTSSTGLHHLLWEILDNSVDEALNGYCDSIEMTLDSDQGVTISDNGRGVPVDLYRNTKKARWRYYSQLSIPVASLVKAITKYQGDCMELVWQLYVPFQKP